jgi:hypothetical protein
VPRLPASGSRRRRYRHGSALLSAVRGFTRRPRASRFPLGVGTRGEPPRYASGQGRAASGQRAEAGGRFPASNRDESGRLVVTGDYATRVKGWRRASLPADGFEPAPVVGFEVPGFEVPGGQKGEPWRTAGASSGWARGWRNRSGVGRLLQSRGGSLSLEGGGGAVRSGQCRGRSLNPGFVGDNRSRWRGRVRGRSRGFGLPWPRCKGPSLG